jgi:hypothetical protein
MKTIVAYGLLVATSVAACDGRHASTPAVNRVTVTVAPETTATIKNASVRFTANVSWTTDNGVDWSIVEGDAGGTIAGDGTYTAPDVHGTFHVRATSRADVAATATATIDVTSVFPISEGSGATAVSGSASNDVWVVEGGRHNHWDGSTWTRATVPSRSGQSLVHFEAVWVGGAKDVWESGVGDLGLELRHWNGTRWTVFAPPSGGFVFGLWGTGPSNVWAVGTVLEPVVHHWDGTAWSGEILEPTIGTVSSLDAAWGSAPDDVWAVGLGDESGTDLRGAAVFRWNGVTWTQFRSGLTGSLLDIWGSAADDIWTVGEDGFLAHWDGQAWSSRPSRVTGNLWSVWGFGANDVWAVGDGGVILHWDGVTWSSVPSPTSATLRGVWGAAPDDVWVVGLAAITQLP